MLLLPGKHSFSWLDRPAGGRVGAGFHRGGSHTHAYSLKNMDKPKCRLCNERHYSYEPHKFAINTDDIAINTAINTVAGTSSVQPHAEAVSVRAVSNPDGAPVENAMTPNRRKRDDYNAYMRDYMRKRRANLVP